MKKYSNVVLAAVAALTLATAPAFARGENQGNNPPASVSVSGDATQSSFGATNAGSGMNAAGAGFGQGSDANYTVSGGSNVVGAAGVGSMSGVGANVVTNGNTHVSSAFGGTMNYSGAMTAGQDCRVNADTNISGSGSVNTGTVASVGIHPDGSTTNGASGSTATNGNFSYSADPHNSSVVGGGMTVGGGTSVVTKTGNGFVVTTSAGSLSQAGVTGSAHMPSMPH